MKIFTISSYRSQHVPASYCRTLHAFKLYRASSNYRTSRERQRSITAINCQSVHPVRGPGPNKQVECPCIPSEPSSILHRAQAFYYPMSVRSYGQLFLPRKTGKFAFIELQRNGGELGNIGRVLSHIIDTLFIVQFTEQMRLQTYITSKNRIRDLTINERKVERKQRRQ